MDGIYERFRKVAEAAPHSPAVIVQHAGFVETWTYGELSRGAEKFAALIRREGVRAGEPCAILSENQPRWLAAYIGILLAHSVVVPLDNLLGAAALEVMLRDSGCELLFASRAQAEKARAAALPLGKKVVVLEDGEVEEWDTHGGVTAAPPPARATSDERALLLYTSGTTAEPKGVVLTHGNLQAVVDGLLEAIPMSSADRGLAVLPLFHILAQLTAVLIPLTVGGTVVMLNDPTPPEILRAFRERGITIFCCVPQFFYLIHQRLMGQVSSWSWPRRRLFLLLLEANGALRDRLGLNLGRRLFRRVHEVLGTRTRLLITGGSRFDLAVGESLHKLGFEILQGYGLTECAGNATITRPGDNPVGSVGRPVGQTEIRILPPEAGATDGEILLRGPCVMAGYHGRPAESAAALDSGWLRTGDRGRLGPGGHLYITGRSKEVIVLSSGKNIYPEELEAHYLHSPFIKELCVVPRTRQTGAAQTECLHVVVVPDMELIRRHGVSNVYETLRYEIDNRSALLPAYKRLLSFQLHFSDLPRTTTRKLKRAEVELLALEVRSREPRPLSEEESVWQSRPDVAKALAVIRRRHPSPPPDIFADDRLDLDLGLDSLSQVELAVHLQEALRVRVADRAIQNARTVRELIDAVLAASEAPAGAGRAAAQENMPWQQILADVPEATRGETRPVAVSLLLFLTSRLALLLFKILLNLKVEGRENLPRAPFILCPNHQSYLDGLLVACSLPWRVFRDLFFVGTPQYFTTRPSRWLARQANIVLLDPESHVIESMRACAAALRRGKCFLIFPEGERTIDGRLTVFRRGPAILSAHTRASLVPAALDGAFEVWPRGGAIRLPGRVRLCFGPPMPAVATVGGCPPAVADAGYRLQTEALAERVGALLAALGSAPRGDVSTREARAGEWRDETSGPPARKQLFPEGRHDAPR